ncbi:hypothetical protein V5O48_005655 [Marasmius crinis-equi]|uniref:F-box domain-containing protein n=1 Tax=Marasmius crinis-equi TaxID=585013 RepID=A0ABR3FM40_9AGAR
MALKEGAMLWLKRSGSLPLKLSLDTNDTWSIVALYQESILKRDIKDPYSDFMHAIATQSRRWQCLWLFLLPPPIFQPFRTLTTKDLPLLETVVESTSLLDVADSHRSLDPDSPILSVFQQSPALRTLFTELVGESDIERMPPRWSQLTTLQIEFTYPTDGFDALQRLSRFCPSLHECTLILYTDLEDPVSNLIPSREWTCLQKLNLLFTGRLGGAYDSEIRRTFTAVTTPALIHLSVAISYTNHASEPNADYIAAMENDVPFHILVEQSHCELLSLDIQILLPQTFSKTLHILPQLNLLTIRRLTLGHTPSNEDLYRTEQFNIAVQALTPPRSCVVCPKLEQIRFMNLVPHQALSLLTLVNARVPHTDLKRLSATFGMLSQADIEILKSAQRQARARELCGVGIEWEFARESGESLCFPRYVSAGQTPITCQSEVLVA